MNLNDGSDGRIIYNPQDGCMDTSFKIHNYKHK